MTTETAALSLPGSLPPRKSFFSTEAFLGAVARSHFPGKPWHVETVTVSGQPYRVLNVGGRIIDRLWAHAFFHEPLPGPPPPDARSHAYLRQVAVSIVPAPADHIQLPLRVAPFIDWHPFKTWEQYQYEAHEGRYPATWKAGAYSRRVLARRLGDVTFTPHDTASDVLPSLFAWKDAKRLRTGAVPIFVYPPAVALYHDLHAQGLLQISTLRAGGRLVSGILGYRWQGRYYARLVAHDYALNALSPGTVLWHALLRHSFESGDEECDFLEGAEPYKWMYATHARLLSSAGREPAASRLERRLRDTAGNLRLKLLHRRFPRGTLARG